MVLVLYICILYHQSGKNLFSESFKRAEIKERSAKKGEPEGEPARIYRSWATCGEENGAHVKIRHELKIACDGYDVSKLTSDRTYMLIRHGSCNSQTKTRAILNWSHQS